METSFRLYSRLNSSYFDLIAGDKETQQTKGLGLLLSKSQTALTAFLELAPLKAKIGKIDFKTINKVIINCELGSSGDEKYRVDILLRFYKDEKPLKALVIEAKSINKGVSVNQTNRQIENYISKRVFREIEEFENEVYGITLTKYSSYIKHENLISITWSDLINIFHRHASEKKVDELFKDYYNFLTNINGVMKFYEKEVFSIPTQKWSSEAINRFFIYECPNTEKFMIKYKPLYLAFRNSGGGEMEKLYKVDEIIIFNFAQDIETLLKDDRYSPENKECISNYAAYMKETRRWAELPVDERQVFILSKNVIELKHKPRPQRNNSFRAYYDLSDLLNNTIV